MTAELSKTYLDNAAKMLGLPLRAGHRAAVEAAFAVLVAQGKLVTDFTLPDETEAAPRYRP